MVQGTNGGITRLGLMASVGGGLLVGTAAYVAGLIAPTLSAVPGALHLARGQWPLILLGAPPSAFHDPDPNDHGASWSVPFTKATRVCHVINAIHGTGDCGQTALLKLAFFCLFCEVVLHTHG